MQWQKRDHRRGLNFNSISRLVVFNLFQTLSSKLAVNLLGKRLKDLTWG